MNHFYEKIPGWFKFQDVYAEAVEQAAQSARFVEVGSWKGKSAAFMGVEIANSEKNIEFYCVDHWLGSNEPAHRDDPDVKSGSLYDTFLRNIAPVRKYITPIRVSSVEAAQRFEDCSLDLVFLDASHDLENVRADLAAWMPKLKIRGTLAGDDWKWKGVHDAVLERVPRDRVEVLGEGKGLHWRVRL